MRKARTSAISMLCLWIALTLFAAPAWSQTQRVLIRFSARALGQCFVDYGLWGSGSGDGSPWLADWYGIGAGKASFGGFAEAIPIEDPQFEDPYSSSSLQALGVASFSWVEEDGSNHQISALFYSTEAANGLFVPNEDYFLSYPLEFRGIYRINSAVHVVSGEFAWFISIQISPENSPSLRAVWVTWVLLLDEATQKGYSVMWSQEETEIMNLQAGISLTLLPPARIFKASVEIMSPQRP